uniref:Uncharacterized protein n=1 Tax=Anguilla anguilla TaxID=7936 RepID=A0A0E9UNA3_ANGAN
MKPLPSLPTTSYASQGGLFHVQDSNSHCGTRNDHL